MKKILKYSCILTFISLILFSCRNDESNDSNNTSKIVGKWQLSEVLINGVVDNPNSSNAIYDPCDYKSWIRYNSDGTIDEYDDCTKKVTLNSGTYSIKNNILTLNSKEFGIPINVTIINLSDNKFTYEFTLFETQRLSYTKIDN